MVCSVGLSAATACAAIRAGIARFDELPFHDNQGEPILGASVPGLESDLRPGDRVFELLAGALRDWLHQARRLALANTPLLVGLAERERPGAVAALGASLIQRIEDELQVRFHRALSRVIPKGHTGGFECLAAARELLQDADIPGCLVCAADTYLNARSLLWLDRAWRLKRQNHSNGVIPGEAAAAIYVTRTAPANSQVTVQVTGLAFGHEEAGIFTDQPLRGLGLTEATKVALGQANLSFADLDFRLSDVTGESYGFKEVALVEARLLRARKEALPLWHPADTIGDTGAAAGVCQLVVAQQAFQREYAPGHRALCCTSAVAGGRAALVLQRHKGKAS